MAYGVTTIDFGSVPTQRATVVVPGQTAILSTSNIEAYFMSEPSADHNAYEHEMAAQDVGLTGGYIVVGTSFTIVAVSTWLLTGIFNVRWVWV